MMMPNEAIPTNVSLQNPDVAPVPGTACIEKTGVSGTTCSSGKTSLNGPGTALSQDLSRLISLWHRCFGESLEESGYFLQHRFHPEEIYVWRIDGTVCAMIHLIPVVMNGLRGGYLYAVATDPAVQGQGICRRLHAYVFEQAAAMGYDFLCLIPASESLFGFYEQMGYEVWFYKENYLLDYAPANQISGNPNEASSGIFAELSNPQPSISSAASCKEEPPVCSETSAESLLPALSAAPMTYCYEADMRMALELHAHYEGVFLNALFRTASETVADHYENFIQEGQSSHVTVRCSCAGPAPLHSDTDQGFFAAGYCEDGELTLNFSDTTDRHAVLSAAVPYAKAQDCHTLTLLFQTESDTDTPAPVRTPHAMGLWLTTPRPERIPPQIGLMYT